MNPIHRCSIQLRRYQLLASTCSLTSRQLPCPLRRSSVARLLLVASWQVAAWRRSNPIRTQPTKLPKLG